MVKNFLNTGRQEKLIFGETCVNYLFGEMQRFSDDLKFSKNSVTSLSGSKVVKTTTMMY
jgi:predicted nucleotidyltransferase component of viral defense system